MRFFALIGCLVLLGFMRVPGAWTPIDLESATVAQWKLNENTTDYTLYDSKSTKNGLLLNGASYQYTNAAGTPHHVTGKVDGAIDFDGVNDYVSVAYHFPQANYALAFWIYYTRPASGIVAEMGNASYRNFQVRIYGTDLGADQYKLNFGMYDGTAWRTVLSTSTVPENQWVHVVAQLTGTKLQIYFNGSEVGSTSWTGSATTAATQAMVISKSVVSSSFYFACKLDDMRYHNRALTDEEIRFIYNLGTGREDRSGTL
ncbi:MAG: LamG domain-containing protein [Bryobacteraceae bacterium]